MPRTQKPLTLDEHTESVLKDYISSFPNTLVCFKAQTLLGIHSGVTYEQLGAMLPRSESTLKTWVTDFRNAGLASVVCAQLGNQWAAKLTGKQKAAVLTALQKGPDAYGIAKEFWDVPTLKDYIKTEFDVQYASDRSYHLLLKHSGLSFKYPTTFDKRRGAVDDIEHRMDQIRAEVAGLPAGTKVFAADEVKVELEALVRKCWIRTGVKSVVSVDRTRESVSYSGFLDLESGEVDLFEIPWQNSETTLEVLKALLGKYPDSDVAVVWDNAPWHRSALIKANLATGMPLARLHLISFPPYAPDYNPIEHVWKDTKEKIANRQRQGLGEVKTAFKEHIGSRKFQYAL